MTDTKTAIDEILEEHFYNEHEDNDTFVCASRYRTCEKCGKKCYFMNLHREHPDARQVPNECNCTAKAERAEAKLAILALHTQSLTQLLGEMPKHQYDSIQDSVADSNKKEGFNNCLSEVRQLIQENMGCGYV